MTYSDMLDDFMFSIYMLKCLFWKSSIVRIYLFPVRGCVCVAAVCSGEITDSAGVVLSPNWPEAYDKGQDCIWGIHVEEDKRIMLDIQV